METRAVKKRKVDRYSTLEPWIAVVDLQKLVWSYDAISYAEQNQKWPEDGPLVPLTAVEVATLQVNRRETLLNEWLVDAVIEMVYCFIHACARRDWTEPWTAPSPQERQGYDEHHLTKLLYFNPYREDTWQTHIYKNIYHDLQRYRGIRIWFQYPYGRQTYTGSKEMSFQHHIKGFVTQSWSVLNLAVIIDKP